MMFGRIGDIGGTAAGREGKMGMTGEGEGGGGRGGGRQPIQLPPRGCAVLAPLPSTVSETAGKQV